MNNTSLNPKIEWLFGGNPQAIKDQEARGQKELVDSTNQTLQILPTNMPLEAREYLEKNGVEFIGEIPDDDMFQHVKLPEGWEIRSTDHSMWTELVANGEKVASIFYKAAFYDRSAFLRLDITNE